MVPGYQRPDYPTGSPNMAAAGISNVVVTTSQLKPSNGGKRKKRKTIKKGGGSFVYSGPQPTTTTPTNYNIVNTSQNLATHTANAQIQSKGDALTGGIKSKRNKRKRRKTTKRKSKKRRR